MKISFYLLVLTTLLRNTLVTGATRDEICEGKGVVKNIQELARKFEHLSLQQKRKIKEWSSEKTLEENLAAFNVTDLIEDMHLQQCVIVEIGEGFCSLFVETRNETGYSCNGTASNTQEIFLGVCECSKIHSWQFCGSQLKSERNTECIFKEATSKQENNARVHRRLCDVTEMAKWNTCNCSHSINDQILLQTEGFPSCYRAPISQSVCYPRSVCGRSRCTPTLLASNVRSVQCDPECPGGRPFCEQPVFPTSVASKINSEWSDWEEPECNATSGEGFLISRATCLDKERGNCALDCYGPWKSCCPETLSPCACDVRIVEQALIATRILGPCTALSNKESLDPWEVCTGTTERKETTQLKRPKGEERESAKHLGPELVQKMLESLTDSLKMIPGMSRNSRKDMMKNEKHPKPVVNLVKKEQSSTKHKLKGQRGSTCKRRHKRFVSKEKRNLRQLLWWQKHDGEYEYFDEVYPNRAVENVCKRDCEPPTTKAETWDDNDEAELDILDDGVETTTESSEQVVGETEGVLVTDRPHASATKNATSPQAEITDIDEEEDEEDAGQEEQEGTGPDNDSQEIREEDDLDIDLSSNEPLKPERNSSIHKSENKETKTSKMPKVLLEKKKSGKGIGHHKTRLKEPEVLEDEGEEEGDEDVTWKSNKENRVLDEEMSRAETEYMSPEEQEMTDDYSQPEEEKPGRNLKETILKTVKSKSRQQLGNMMLLTSVAILGQIL